MITTFPSQRRRRCRRRRRRRCCRLSLSLSLSSSTFRFVSHHHHIMALQPPQLAAAARRHPPTLACSLPDEIINEALTALTLKPALAFSFVSPLSLTFSSKPGGPEYRSPEWVDLTGILETAVLCSVRRSSPFRPLSIRSWHPASMKNARRKTKLEFRALTYCHGHIRVQEGRQEDRGWVQVHQTKFPNFQIAGFLVVVSK